MQVIALQVAANISDFDVMNLVNLIKSGNLFIKLLRARFFFTAELLDTDLVDSSNNLSSALFQHLDIAITVFHVELARASQLPRPIKRFLSPDQRVLHGIIAQTLVDVFTEVNLALSLHELLAVTIFLNATFDCMEGQVEENKANDKDNDCPHVKRVHSEGAVIGLELCLRWFTSRSKVDTNRQDRCNAKHEQDAKQVKNTNVFVEAKRLASHVVVELDWLTVAAQQQDLINPVGDKEEKAS